jgi:TonB family protein
VLTILSACRSDALPKSLPVEEKKAANQGRIVVGDRLGNGRMIRQPRPVYPKAAKKARIQGVVRLNIVIAKNGEVKEIQVVSGQPALVPAAIKAVEQWQYPPMYLNGEPAGPCAP